MKSIFTILLLAVFLNAVYSETLNLDSGLVAYYPFNGNANNAAGKTGHGQLIRDVSFINDRFKKPNSAVYFGGDSSYIVFQEAEVDLPMGNDPRSFSLWIKSGKIETVDYLLCYGTEQTAQMCHFDIVHDRPRLQFGYMGFSLMGQSIVTDNHWHHIVCVFDGLYARIYVDGKWDNECIPGKTIEQVNTIPNETGIWTMAIQQTLLWDTYIGSMDDIRIYNRALSEEEIYALYDYRTEPISKKILENFPKLTQSRDADFQQILDDEAKENNVLGLSAAVITPDWQWQGASGLSSSGSPQGLSTRSQMTTDKLFRIGRPANTYISALIIELAEEGKLSLDDSLHQWLPSHCNIDSTITIRQLLNHTSGLSGWNDTVYEQFWANPSRIFTPEELFYYIGEPYCSPGESNVPSVTNYFLLGLITKEIIQHNISTELRNRYLDSLNLNNTFLAIEEQVPNNIAHEHREVDSWKYFDYTSYAKSANAINSSSWVSGAMYSTAMDFARWIYALLGGEVISQDALKQMLTFDPFPYDGLGVLRELDYQRELYGNGGPTDIGYRTSTTFSPHDNICINIFNNYWPGDLGPCRNKLLYTTLVYRNQLPSPRFEPLEMDINYVLAGSSTIDTFFTIYNDGVSSDTISLSVDYGNLASEAFSVEPLTFNLAPGLSRKVNISINPSLMEETTSYRPKIAIHSLNDLILSGVLTERLYLSYNPNASTNIIESRLSSGYFNLELYQNWPNPFSHETTINFNLPTKSLVKLIIYDCFGHQIKLLKNDTMYPGNYSVSWNGSDNRGKQVTKGVYFIGLETGDKVLVKKILKVK
jgi:D-alanyl-D-alanine carboxypeptidase